MSIDGLVSEEMLEHYGMPKRSGRYAWGSGKNPYHHGQSSPFGRLRARRAEKKKAKARAAQAEKMRQAKAAKAEHERKKQEALRSGSAKALAPYIRELSDDELKAAKSRIELEAQFRKLAVDEASRGDPKVAARMAKIDRAVKYAGTATEAYNTVAKIYNAFSSSGELPIIGGNSTRQSIRQKKWNQASAVEEIREKKKQNKAKTRQEEAKARTAELESEKMAYEAENEKNRRPQPTVNFNQYNNADNRAYTNNQSYYNAQSQVQANVANMRDEKPNDYRKESSEIAPYVERYSDIEVVKPADQYNHLLEDKKRR